MSVPSMRFLEVIYRNVVRRRFRTGLTVPALATAMTAIVALLGICNGFKRAFSDVYGAHGIDIVVSRSGSADRLSSAVDAEVVGRLAEMPAIDRVAGVLLETLSLEEQGIYGIPTMGLERDSRLLDDYESASTRKAIDASVRFSQRREPSTFYPAAAGPAGRSFRVDSMLPPG